MGLLNTSNTIGQPNKNLIFETAGKVYIKVQDRFYELDFKNQGPRTIINNNTTEELPTAPKVPEEKYLTEADLWNVLDGYMTKRDWNDVMKTREMLENAKLPNFTESITPITVQTMQTIVGSEQLQFEFITSMTNDTITGPIIKVTDGDIIECPHGIIEHYTLDGPSAIAPDTQLKEYCRWEIEDKTFFLESEKSYYLYLKVNKIHWSEGTLNSPDSEATKTGIWAKTGTGEYIISQTSYELERIEDPGYYYLLYAIIGDKTGNTRSIGTLNGFTEILPGQITAYVFRAPNGDSFIDLRNNVFNFGNKLMFTGDGNGGGVLRLKGALIVDDGGNSAPTQLYRGEYKNDDTVYYPGNTVTYTDSDGKVSTYLFIADEASTGATAPINNTNFWKCVMEGVAGQAGATPRMGSWNNDGNTTYYDGSISDEKGFYWQDYVYYKPTKSYYRCKLTYTPSTSARTPDRDTTHWVIETNFSFVSSSVIFSGTEGNGWIIDEGEIYHTGNKAKLTKEGEIFLGNSNPTQEPSVENSNFSIDSRGDVNLKGNFEISGDHSIKMIYGNQERLSISTNDVSMENTQKVLQIHPALDSIIQYGPAGEETTISLTQRKLGEIRFDQGQSVTTVNRAALFLNTLQYQSESAIKYSLYKKGSLEEFASITYRLNGNGSPSVEHEVVANTTGDINCGDSSIAGDFNAFLALMSTPDNYNESGFELYLSYEGVIKSIDVIDDNTLTWELNVSALTVAAADEYYFKIAPNGLSLSLEGGFQVQIGKDQYNNQTIRFSGISIDGNTLGLVFNKEGLFIAPGTSDITTPWKVGVSQIQGQHVLTLNPSSEVMLLNAEE